MRAGSPKTNITGTGSSGTGSVGHRDFTFLDKINTLSRVRRHKKEIDELAAEARQAMEDPLHPITPEIGPAGYQLAEGEECSMVEPSSKEQPLVTELIEILIDWVNNELTDDRIVIRDIESDLYDGQVLQKLYEKFTGTPINHPELTQTEMGQRQRLKLVLEEINHVLDVSSSYAAQNWPISAVHNRELVPILRLLVALVRRFSPDLRLPTGVRITVLIVRKLNGVLQHRRQAELVTDDKEAQNGAVEKDAINVLVDCAVPERLEAFEQMLLNFVNYHLSKLNLVLTNIETEMDDGVHFILLLGLLGGYFVPLHAYSIAPTNSDEKMANIQLALQLLRQTEGTVSASGVRAEDLLQRDLKATLRFLYTLYARYKDL